MNTLAINIELPNIYSVQTTEDTLTFELDDGRTLSVPIAWYPRLQYATPEERENWRLIGGGQGIHWESIDEDINIQGIIAGKPSGESQSSFRRWLESRKIA